MFFLNSKFQSEIDTLETTLFINNEHIIRNVMTLNLKVFTLSLKIDKLRIWKVVNDILRRQLCN